MSKVLTIMIIGTSIVLGYFFGETRRSEIPGKVSKFDESLPSKSLLEQKFTSIETMESELPLRNYNINVINFWATWCPPCKKEIPIFNKKFLRDSDKGVGIIGIALDEEGQIKDFLATQSIDYPHFYGQQEVSELMSHYGNSMGVLPFTVITDRNGKYLSSVVGEISYDSLSKAVSDAQKLIKRAN